MLAYPRNNRHRVHLSLRKLEVEALLSVRKQEGMHAPRAIRNRQTDRDGSLELDSNDPPNIHPLSNAKIEEAASRPLSTTSTGMSIASVLRRMTSMPSQIF